MALQKNITLDNGIVLSYHRVVSVNNVTNHSSSIEVGSYINEEQRKKEIEYYNNPTEEGMNVYIEATFYSIEYNKDLNVDSAYEFLKTLDKFKDAENI
jgi:hypothetical protein